jgi:hypothetical protein
MNLCRYREPSQPAGQPRPIRRSTPVAHSLAQVVMRAFAARLRAEGAENGTVALSLALRSEASEGLRASPPVTVKGAAIDREFVHDDPIVWAR